MKTTYLEIRLSQQIMQFVEEVKDLESKMALYQFWQAVPSIIDCVTLRPRIEEDNTVSFGVHAIALVNDDDLLQNYLIKQSFSKHILP